MSILQVQGAKIDELTRRLSTAQKTTDTQKDTITRCLAVVKEQTNPFHYSVNLIYKSKVDLQQTKKC